MKWFVLFLALILTGCTSPMFTIQCPELPAAIAEQDKGDVYIGSDTNVTTTTDLEGSDFISKDNVRTKQKVKDESKEETKTE